MDPPSPNDFFFWYLPLGMGNFEWTKQKKRTPKHGQWIKHQPRQWPIQYSISRRHYRYNSSLKHTNPTLSVCDSSVKFVSGVTHVTLISAHHYIVSDLSSLGASLLSPILRNSDTESIKSEEGPATKRRRLSVSSAEMLEQLVHRASPLPLTSAHGARPHPGSPGHGHQHHGHHGPRRQRNTSNRWGAREDRDRGQLPARSNQQRRR